MKTKQVVRIIPILLLFLALSDMASAQCAMCEAVAESASEDKPGMAKGLNNGILYLMFAPYLLFAVLGIVFFRKKIVYFYRELSSLQ